MAETVLQTTLPKKGERFISLRAEDATVDVESRSISLSFSSDLPVEFRGWDGSVYREILDHGEDSVRMERLLSKAPLLFNHDRDELIGVVESAEVRDGKGYATVRFSKSDEGEKRFQEVQDGILANVSVAYARNRVVSESEQNGVETVRVMDWEPLEVSLVTVPADFSVGVGRNQRDGDEAVPVERQTPPQKKEDIMSDSKPDAPSVNVDEVRADERKAERKRISEIESLSRHFKERGIDVAEKAEKAKSEGHSVDAFRAAIIEDIPGVRKADPVQIPSDVKKRYSLIRAIRCAKDGKMDGAEGEVHSELLKNRGTPPAEMGILVPSELFGFRTLTAGTSGTGADLVSEQYGDVIEKLDNMPVVRQAGARMLTGLSGDLVLPKITGGATAYWLSETASTTASDIATDTLRLTPHRLAVLTKVSNQLSTQSSMSVEQLLREDIAKRIEIALDLAAFQGTGAAGEPKGLFNFDTSASGINTNTYSAAATMALVVTAIKELVSDNAHTTGSISGIIDPTTWGKWAAKSVDTGSGRFLWQGGLTDGIIAPGFKGYVSNHLPSNKSVFGVFSEMLIGMWESINLIVDPYTSKHQGLVEIYGEVQTDLGVRHPEAFVISTDSAAQ